MRTECFSIFINNVFFWLPSKSLARSQHSLVLTKTQKLRNMDIHIKSKFEF